MEKKIIKELNLTLDFVLVKKLPDQDAKTEAGLYVPSVGSSKTYHASVVHVGSGRWSQDGSRQIPMSVKVGDEVICDSVGGMHVSIEGENLILLREAEIIGVVVR